MQVPRYLQQCVSLKTVAERFGHAAAVKTLKLLPPLFAGCPKAAAVQFEAAMEAALQT